MSVAKQVIHLSTSKTIFMVRDKHIELIALRYQSKKVNTSIHCHLNHHLTKCVLSLFNRNKTPSITVLWRLTNPGLIALLPTLSIEAWPSLCLWVRKSNSNTARWYQDQFYLYGIKLNFQWWFHWQTKYLFNKNPVNFHCGGHANWIVSS